MLIISPKITKIEPKMLKIIQIDPKICKIPNKDKKSGTSPQNPGPQAYWAAYA